LGFESLPRSLKEAAGNSGFSVFDDPGQRLRHARLHRRAGSTGREAAARLEAVGRNAWSSGKVPFNDGRWSDDGEALLVSAKRLVLVDADLNRTYAGGDAVVPLADTLEHLSRNGCLDVRRDDPAGRIIALGARLGATAEWGKARGSTLGARPRHRGSLSGERQPFSPPIRLGEEVGQRADLFAPDRAIEQLGDFSKRVFDPTRHALSVNARVVPHRRAHPALSKGDDGDEVTVGEDRSAGIAEARLGVEVSP
jgi:hypothetical protein